MFGQALAVQSPPKVQSDVWISLMVAPFAVTACAGAGRTGPAGRCS